MLLPIPSSPPLPSFSKGAFSSPALETFQNKSCDEGRLRNHAAAGDGPEVATAARYHGGAEHLPGASSLIRADGGRRDEGLLFEVVFEKGG